MGSPTAPPAAREARQRAVGRRWPSERQIPHCRCDRVLRGGLHRSDWQGCRRRAADGLDLGQQPPSGGMVFGYCLAFLEESQLLKGMVVEHRHCRRDPPQQRRRYRDPGLVLSRCPWPLAPLLHSGRNRILQERRQRHPRRRNLSGGAAQLVDDLGPACRHFDNPQDRANAACCTPST